ncbi:IPExxxVDY family protein [Wenyingzhuangia sp. chi5]|uniref:IPExxxVDY family protein n=1 Tax=Wenyingzhuangia gilva TaxID=3057677 RepID=A0ABT8VQ31_9FLAO|nr:IPExxxVDY family protein [Wenyingzhuangia sp. chi5]MDO3694079.1 IPExxxVDY family protein [Wenyingzhuangia sp. chi5]
MAANYLTFCELDEQDYQIIAVHTVLQDYKLAYLLNNELGFKFKRVVPDLDYVIEGKKAFFSSFQYEDSKNLINWYLVKNKYKVKSFAKESLGLFQTEDAFTSSYVYLQPEVKEADFIVKVQGDFLASKLKILLQQINKIEGVVTAYAVDTVKLNHKEYLIF